MQRHPAAAIPIVLYPLLAVSVLMGASRTQCEPAWAPGQGAGGVLGTVHAMTEWDPDGVGPAAPLLVIGGYFAAAGTVRASGIATWDPATGEWGTLGGSAGVNSQFSYRVNGLAVDKNGDLVAVGDFQTVAGQPANGLARWDGSAWHPMGLGVSHFVSSVTRLPNGDLVIGGDFSTLDGMPCSHVGRWDGQQWWPLGSGMNSTVNSVATAPNGDVIAGGYFTSAGGVPASLVARWDGSNWSALGSGVQAGSVVHAVTTLPNGDVVVGGSFTQAGGNPASRVAYWDGSTWSGLGAGTNDVVLSLHTLPGGQILAGGNFTSAGGTSANRIARWNGFSWGSLSSGLDTGAALAMHSWSDSDFLVGGHFFQAGGIGADRIARWNNGAWAPLDKGINGEIDDFLPLPDGSVVAVGNFRSAGGHAVRGVARFDGSDWQPIDGALGGVLGRGRAVTRLPNGDLVVGGFFNSVGGVAAQNVARWDGLSWWPLATGLAGQVRDLVVLANGDLVAVGDFHMAGLVPADGVAVWNGSAWSALGTGVTVSGTLDFVSAAAVLPDASLVVGGRFSFPSSPNLARWDGAAWQPYGGGANSYVYSLLVRPDGDLAVGGTFSTVGVASSTPFGVSGLARFDGNSWSAFGGSFSGEVRGLANLPGGDLLAVGNFSVAYSVFANGVARFGPSGWSTFGGGLTLGFPGSNYNNCAAVLADGTVALGGSFVLADGAISAYFARLEPTCPANVAALGSGCSGSGGANLLTATGLPWLGDTFRAEATGLPANGVVLSAYGFATTSVPLPSLLPQGKVGCTLSTLVDAAEVLLPAAGRATTQLPVPAAPVLVGAVLHHQVLPIELGAGNSIVEVTASNRLTLTIGAF